MALFQSQRVLKATAARELGSRVAFNFEDLHTEGEAYLLQMRRQADALLAAAEQDAAKIREAAFNEGKDAGRKEGLQDAARQIESQAARVADQRMAEQMQSTLPAVAAIAQALSQERDQWLIRWEESATRLAIAIAERLVHRELALRPETSRTMIAETLRLAAGHPQLRIHLHPDDAQRLGDRADDVVRTLTACADAVLLTDPKIQIGGCRIETQHGEIDGRLETMLDRIAEELFG